MPGAKPSVPDAHRDTSGSAREREAIPPRLGRQPLVGRRRELARLDAEIRAAAAGDVRVVTVSGEAGIGKSRLLAEAGAIVASADGRVALARCVDERGMPPFLPWIGLGAALDALAPPDSPAPRLKDLFLDSDPAPSGQAGISPEGRRLRLFAAVTEAIARVAHDHLVWLALDDLQWSDPSSNQLLRYVAGHLPPCRLVIAGSYRVEELRANDELVRTLDELDRLRLLTEISVDPLTEAETADLVAALVAGASPAAVAAIRVASGGNPFLVEEIVREMAETGELDRPAATSRLPRGAVAVVHRRLDGVSEACRATLRLAALAGRELSVDLLAAATQRLPEEIAVDLDGAAAAALVRPLPVSPSGSSRSAVDYEFLHDRVRESIDQTIPAAERRLLHGRLARALDVSTPVEDPVRLAALLHHLERGGLVERASAVAARLGDAAMRTSAPAEAVAAYERVAALRPNPSGALLLKLGDARLLAGGDAVAAYLAAERAFGRAGDTAGVARSLQRTGTARARREEHDLAVACLEAAAAAWEDQSVPDAGPALAATLVELCAVLGTSVGRYAAAERAGSRALQLAASVPDQLELEASARLALAGTVMRAGRLAEGAALLAPALSLALRVGHQELAAEVAGVLANHAYWIGDLDASERHARARLDLAGKSGDPYARRHALPWLANIEMARGRWDPARSLIAQAAADLARVESPEPHAFLSQLTGMVALRLGETDTAVEHLERSLAGFRRIGLATLPWYIGVLATAYHAAGDVEAAQRTATETAGVIASLPAGALPRAPAMAQLGLLAARTGDLTAVRRWYAELRPYAGQHHWVLVDRVLGVLAAATGETAAAERHLAAAGTTAVRGGIQPELALVVAERARLHRDPAAAARATAALRALGMVADADHYAATLSPPAPAAYPAGLTGREVEVLRLVVAGLTNRDIGERLGISEKTVTNHLTHIFTKANLDNRAAAVDFAHRHRLIGE